LESHGAGFSQGLAHIVAGFDDSPAGLEALYSAANEENFH